MLDDPEALVDLMGEPSSAAGPGSGGRHTSHLDPLTLGPWAPPPPSLPPARRERQARERARERQPGGVGGDAGGAVQQQGPRHAVRQDHRHHVSARVFRPPLARPAARTRPRASTWLGGRQAMQRPPRPWRCRCHFCRQKKLCGEENCPRCSARDASKECIGEWPAHSHPCASPRALLADVTPPPPSAHLTAPPLMRHRPAAPQASPTARAAAALRACSAARAWSCATARTWTRPRRRSAPASGSARTATRTTTPTT